MTTPTSLNLVTARGPTPHSCLAGISGANNRKPATTTTSRRRRMRALRREWKDYQDAVDQKDLARALRSLKSLEEEAQQPPYDAVRDWQVLDTCLNADDMMLVSAAYAYLQDRRFLPHFAKFRHIVLEGTREVTPSVVKSETGLEVTKLSPKKWGVSGASSLFLLSFLGGSSFLLSRGIDIRINLVAILGFAFADSILLGGSCLALISSYWPPYKRRILVHEAGHLLVAYLMGCPIRGVILNPFAAMRMGTQGQAGTQFWDEKMSKELAEGQLSGTTFDRYCMVLFAGIAAEALVYGEAEGGENDENLFRSICVLLNPPLSVAEMSNQARWSVLQAYNLLKWHRVAHTAAVKALESGGSLSTVIMRVEEAMLTRL